MRADATGSALERKPGPDGSGGELRGELGHHSHRVHLWPKVGITEDRIFGEGLVWTVHSVVAIWHLHSYSLLLQDSTARFTISELFLAFVAPRGRKMPMFHGS